MSVVTGLLYPRIVVVMSVYNEARYLDETIPAVLGQSMRDFILVVFNNGSTDGSKAIIQRYEREDPRVLYLGVPRNIDPPTAANTLTPLVHNVWPECRWFLGAGADDVMDPDYLKAILAAADAHPEVNLIFSPWRWLDHPERGVKVFPPINRETIADEHQIPAWHACTRELWEAVGPHDSRIRVGSDWDWALRAVLTGYARVHQLDRPYLSLRVRDDRPSLSEEADWPTLHGHLRWMAEQYA